MTEPTRFDIFDMSEILTEEARMLRLRAKGSARVVFLVISLATLLLMIAGAYDDAALWFTLASAMVGVTLIYAHIIWPDGVAPEQTRRYLRGHVVISACTGLLWGGFAIYQVDPGWEVKTFITGVFLSTITTGGAMAGTIYRPGYIALATGALIPFGTYLLLFSEGPMRIFGLLIYLYYGFCYTTNEHAAQRTREWIVSSLGRDAAQSLFEKNLEIERLNAEKSRFMAAISHDMIQPLVAERHLLSVLTRQIHDAGQLDLIDKIRQTIASQQHLLDHLVEFSQIETAKIRPHPTEIDVTALFEQLRAEFAERAAQKGLTISLQVDAPSLTSDRHLLLRVLRNLISNAVKFSFESGTVTLQSSMQGTMLHLSVCDTGPGIAPHDQKRVFDEYVRLPEGQKHPGLGLGMTISRQLSTLLGGQVTLVSEPGQGTCATVVLLQHAMAAPQVEETEPPLILVISQGDDSTLGGWSELFSGWMWKFVHAADWSKAQIITTTLGVVPDLILWEPGEAQTAEPRPAGPLATVPVLEIRPAATPSQPSGIATASLTAPFTPDELRRALEALLA